MAGPGPAKNIRLIPSCDQRTSSVGGDLGVPHEGAHTGAALRFVHIFSPLTGFEGQRRKLTEELLTRRCQPSPTYRRMKDGMHPARQVNGLKGLLEERRG